MNFLQNFEKFCLQTFIKTSAVAELDFVNFIPNICFILFYLYEIITTLANPNLMRKLLPYFAILFVLYSCDKEGFIFSNKKKLPAETRTGANTVGCLVNGKVFLPHGKGGNTGVNCFYQIEEGQHYFSLNFADYSNSKGELVALQTTKIDISEGNVYKLNKTFTIEPDFTGAAGIYEPYFNNSFYTNTIQTGELKITHLSKSIISGTFWFNAVNSKGEKVEIREGRFDWSY